MTPSARARRYGWNRLAIYLPVLLMGSLALGSYWIVRLNPTTATTPATPQASQHPDYFMHGFAVRTFGPDGALQQELRGTQAQHFPGTGQLEVQQARVRSLNAQGQAITAQARQLHSNADHTDYQLQGQVRVTRGTDDTTAPTLQLEGEHLQLNTQTQQLQSNQPVHLVRGHNHMYGNQLHYDHQQGIATLQGQVRATLQSQ